MKKALKILVIALMLSAIALPVQAQRRTVHYLANYENEPYHFGFLLAYNQMMYTIKTVPNYQNTPFQITPMNANEISFVMHINSDVRALYVYNVETRQMPGFTVGIIGSKRLGRYFDLRLIPSLSFNDRQLKYTIVTEDQNGETKMMPELTRSIFSTFVEFPLNIKYRSKRYNNIGAYIMAGINPKLDLASRKKSKIKVPQLNADGTPVYEPNGSQKMTEGFTNLVTKRFDFAAEIGTGFDIYNQWFKMGIEVKMSYGLLDIVKGEASVYTTPFDKLSNKMFQVSLIFE